VEAACEQQVLISDEANRIVYRRRLPERLGKNQNGREQKMVKMPLKIDNTFDLHRCSVTKEL